MAQKLLNSVNDRTYQEVEYLKKSLGPVLVAALAEICIRRPADPIEYLGHWLLRWRYNEELKRRDVQNAMDVVKQRQWAQMKEDATAALQSQAEPTQVSKDVPDDAYARGMLEEEEEAVPDTEMIFDASNRGSADKRKSTQRDSTGAARASNASGGAPPPAAESGKPSLGSQSRKSTTGAAAKLSGAGAKDLAEAALDPNNKKMPTPTESKRPSQVSGGAEQPPPPPAEQPQQPPAENLGLSQTEDVPPPSVQMQSVPPPPAADTVQAGTVGDGATGS